VTNPSGAKGSQFERDVVKALRYYGGPFRNIERAYGAGRPKDVGDLDGTPGIVWELKNHREIRLSEWMDETEVERENANAEIGILVVKRRNQNAKRAYCVVDLETMAELVTEWMEHT
jgi:hypothetical protein